VRGKRGAPTGRPRTRLKRRNAKRKGSAFPTARQREYCRWLVTEHECLLADRITWFKMSAYDVQLERGFVHRCWGPTDPAHVGEHRSQGAPDFGRVVPLCRAAHQFYDEHRSEWRAVTRLSEAKMASAASGYALRYVKQGRVAADAMPETVGLVGAGRRVGSPK